MEEDIHLHIVRPAWLPTHAQAFVCNATFVLVHSTRRTLLFCKQEFRHVHHNAEVTRDAVQFSFTSWYIVYQV